MPPRRLRQLYNTVAILAFTYAADLWFTNIHRPNGNTKRLGSVKTVKKLTSVQCRVAKLITSALSTTAGNILEVHANLLPIDLILNKITFCAAARIASLPPLHPLFSPSRKAAKRYVKRHRPPLHNLFGLLNVNPSTIETVLPTHRRNNYTPVFTTTIAPDKPTALTQATLNHNTKVSIYCNGSGYEGGVGASTCLYIDSIETRALQYYLGPDSEHTVYEAEIIGIYLAFHLLSSLMFSPCPPTIVGLDSQATLRALLNQRSHPAHYLLDLVHNAAENLHAKHYKLRNPSTSL